jgi:glyoxylase-like metal-dependent hydrolase (beta-lactamase superfamily II)
MITQQVAPGVTRITQASTNCYLVAADEGLTFIDAGLPRTWAQADRAVRESGNSWSDVGAIVLTHAHSTTWASLPGLRPSTASRSGYTPETSGSRSIPIATSPGGHDCFIR